MHLVSFIKNQKTHVGILHGENSIIDLSFYENQVPNDVNQIIELNSLVKLKEIQAKPTCRINYKKRRGKNYSSYSCAKKRYYLCRVKLS